MKKRFWLLSVLLPLSFSSCQFYNTLFGEEEPFRPDTLVHFVGMETPQVSFQLASSRAADSLAALASAGEDKSHCQVQFVETKQGYDINTYWMDPIGNRLYKKQEEPYKHGRLHGYKYAWSYQGVLIHKSRWNEGVMIDTFRTWYENGALKEYVLYDSIGNRINQVEYHPNGKAATDTIFYLEGKKHGIFKRYDDKGYHSETYCYSNDTLKYVNVFKAEYTRLESMEASRLKRLADQARKDSIAAKKSRDSIFKLNPNALIATTTTATEKTTTTLPSGAADILIEAKKRNARFINIWE